MSHSIMICRYQGFLRLSFDYSLERRQVAISRCMAHLSVADYVL
jgi:hypothetical protein